MVTACNKIEAALKLHTNVSLKLSSSLPLRYEK